MSSTEHWRRGSPVLVRDVWQGAVLTAVPHTVVTDTTELTALYRAPGTVWATPVFTERMEGFEKAAEGDLAPRGRRTWDTHHVLMLMRPGDAYSPQAFVREEDGELVAWYINLQEPFRRSRLGFDTMDAVLDIVCPPDLSSWAWKDEDELDRVVELGLAPRELADEIRASGEAVIDLIERGEAWWTEWAGWTPDRDLPIPQLPEGWDALG